MSARKVTRGVTLDTLMEKVANVAENRRAAARPFTLKTLGVTVLVAPPAGLDFYKKAMEIGFGGEGGGAIDETFIRTLVKASVIEPELTDAAIDGIIANSFADFQALSIFCMGMAQDLGHVDTTGAEAFLADMDGSTST